MDLTRGEWVIVIGFVLWATYNSINQPLAFLVGAYVGAVISSTLIIGAKRQINGWRRARAADT